MNNNKVIKICIGLLLVIGLVMSIINKSSNNKFLLPITLICLSIVGILNGVLEYKKKNNIFAIFSILASIVILFLVLSGIRYKFS
jgi:FtsH-binding integral membrane protein